MKRFWFNAVSGLLAVMGLGLGIFLPPNQVGAYQEASTPTGTFVTVTYTDRMNVRGGPGTFYDIVGELHPGDVLPALGISPGREWIQVSFPSAPGGIGWVYATYVSVSGGELQIVEAPPTPTPLITSTIDPTLAAAFSVQPTQTRKPTFTPPPPLDVPQFTDASPTRSSGGGSGFIILSLGLMGAIGLLVSYVLRRP